jgi:hypothetical protein
MVVIVWYLDLQLHVPSVSITIGVVSLNPAHGEVYLMQQYVIKFALDLRQVGGFTTWFVISDQSLSPLLSINVS